MKLLFVTVFCLVVAGPAAAFRCLPIEMRDTYVFLTDRGIDFQMVKGRFSVINPFFRPDRPANSTRTGRMDFEGHIAGLSDFSIDNSQRVRVVLQCWQNTCPQLTPDVETVAFLERGEGNRRRLIVTPCEDRVFENPHPSEIRRLFQCATRGNCGQ